MQQFLLQGTKKCLITLVVMMIVVASFCQNKPNTKIDSLINKAKSLQYKNVDSAILLYEIASDYYKSNDFLHLFYATQINIANCYAIQQKNNEALKVYESCLKYHSATKDSVHLYQIYSGMASVSYNLNDSKKTIDYLKMANDVCDVNKFPVLKFNGLLNLENCFVMNQDVDAAFKCLNEAERLLNVVKVPIYTYHLSLKYSYLYYLKKKYSTAIDKALVALQFKGDFDKRLIMEAYNILGLCYLETKQYDKSEIYLDSALVLSKAINSKLDYSKILESKFRLDTSAHNQKKAINDLLEIVATKDSLFEMNKLNFTNDLLIKYQTEKKDADNKILAIENEKRSAIIKWQRFLNFTILISSLLLIVILFFYLRYRNRQQKKEIEKDKIAAELRALKAQLNPHFVQNIFQIISNQVKINPSEVAVFLQKTANYFRSVLNSTEKSVHNFEDEIIFTEKYLQFQQTLFKDKLTYSIDDLHKIDSFGIIVPAMLLQPFIENSIKYGLQFSQKPMHIDIHFYVDERYLYISIIDDGHFETNETLSNEKSYGFSLIGKRLDLFYRLNKNKPKISSNSINDGNGFKVEISLPL